MSDNGANDLGNRRIANGAEKLWLVTEMGQDAGFPDKEGYLFVSGKRYGWTHFEGNPIERPHPNLYIGEEPFVHALRARCARLADDPERAERELEQARSLFAAAGAPGRARALVA